MCNVINIYFIFSLDKLSYEPHDRVVVNLHLENNSAVDVSDSTLKVQPDGSLYYSLHSSLDCVGD